MRQLKVGDFVVALVDIIEDGVRKARAGDYGHVVCVGRGDEVPTIRWQNGRASGCWEVEFDHAAGA